MSKSNKQQDQWAEAQRRCRLSDEEIRMAKALAFQPHSLIKNIPSASQPWKAPVNEWVRLLYERKFASKPVPSQPPAEGRTPAQSKGRSAVVDFRNSDHPWPDKPEIGELVVRLDEPAEFDEEDEDAGFAFEMYGYSPRFEPPRFESPDAEDIAESNTRGLRRQCLYRWAAQSIAVAMNGLPEIRQVAAFGSVAQPLEMEVPRFGQYRRRGMETYHTCRDLDLAVWTADLGKLRDLKKAMQGGLSIAHDTEYGGVAHHQVDVHVFDAATGDYRGRLCIFKECPKGKRECLARGCGHQPFLQQFDGYRFNPARFAAEPKVILVDKASGFVVRVPRIDAKPARIEYRSRPGEDVRF
jgi:hypothetical protein